MKRYEGYILEKGFRWYKSYKKPRSGISYLSKYICLDTETSWNHDIVKPESWIYQWAFTFAGGLYSGRTPEELCDKLEEIVKYYGLCKMRRIKIFVHNLPYDFSYLLIFFHDRWGDPIDFLASSSRKPFMVEYSNGLSFFCSYKLSNKSLLQWGKDLNVKHKKLEEAIDYQAIHNQSDFIPWINWEYQWHDVICLNECIQETLRYYPQYNIATLPLTSTGFVRNEVRDEFFLDFMNNNEEFRYTRLSLRGYMMISEQISGGLTHGNRHYSNMTVEAPAGCYIKHRDKRSFYPCTQMIGEFGVGPEEWFDCTSIEECIELSKTHDVYVRIILQDILLKGKQITLPYLQTTHCLRKVSKGYEYIEDNGRMIAYRGQCEVVLNAEELKIIKQQYGFEYKIIEVMGFQLGELPKFMKSTIKRHFKLKSDLKNKVKELKAAGAPEEEIVEAEVALMKSKAVLNGIYGVSAQDIIKPVIELINDSYITKFIGYDEIGELLNDYYKSKRNFMRYQWGARTTTLTRVSILWMKDFIESLGGTYLYMDTDSLFYISNDEIEAAIEELNKKGFESCIDQGSFIFDSNNKAIVFDCFEDEDDDIKKFRFLHAKAYAVEHSDQSLDCTIAGVSKYLKEDGKIVKSSTELGSIDNLDDDFTFTKFGGTRAIYPPEGAVIHEYDGNITAGGCIIESTTKTMSAPNFRENDQIYDIKSHNYDIRK